MAENKAEYKLEILVEKPMGIRGEMRFDSTTTDNPMLALSMYMVLNNLLDNPLSGKVKNTITIYRNGECITREDLSADHREHYGIKR